MNSSQEDPEKPAEPGTEVDPGGLDKEEVNLDPDRIKPTKEE